MLPEIISSIPGPKSRALAAELRRYESRNVTFVSPGFPVFWKGAHGVNVWDVDGNRLLDMTSAFGVSGLGFTPEPIVAAMREQAGRLYHAMGDVHPTLEKVELCRELSRLTFEAWGVGGGKTLLANSGSEAVEAALKTAFLATGKKGVLAFRGGYHGLGYGSLTVMGRDDFRAPFERQLADFAVFAPYPNGQAAAPITQAEWEKETLPLLKSASIGAIIVEPVQGRGGEIVPHDWFLPGLRRLADEAGAILICDEIYTGLYRTGKRFAADHWTVVPDIICLGKALTSGFPLAACVARAELMDKAWPESDGEAIHTSTFLGNPLGCRMAVVALRELEREGVAEQVVQAGNWLREALTGCSVGGVPWGRVRGRGLMAGLEVVTAEGKPDPAKAGSLVEGMLAEGVLVLSGGVDRNVMSFTPPFGISREEIEFAVETLARVAK